MYKRIAIVAGTLLLAGCSLFGGTPESETPGEGSDLEVSGARSGIISVHSLDGGLPMGVIRPSAAVGLYATTFLAQGIFLPVRTAALGIAAQRAIIAGQGSVSSDETFMLLQELGNILQVNVPDVLNRSTDRAQALELYVQTLTNAHALGERKLSELVATQESLEDDERAQRRVVRDIDRAIREALDADDFTTAGGRQQELTEAETKLAETETRRDQTEDIADRYEELLEIAANRLVAIEANRKIIVAGLKVIELPGIEDLNILTEGPRRR